MTVDHQSAFDAVVAALAAAGLSVSRPTGDTHADFVIDVGGVSTVVEMKLASTVTPGSLPAQQNESAPAASPTRLLVADRIVGAARDILRERGWSWLDLRGHLHLSGPGLLVDTPVPSVGQPTAATTDPFTGKVALEVACSMLMDPERPASVRGLARELGRSPSSVSTVLESFRRAQLVDSRVVPVVPELFWETASAWRPETTELARLATTDEPAVADAPKIGRDDPTDVGWALTDALAAAQYGAPIGVRSEHPPDFYVPDRATARRAEALLGTPSSSQTRAARIRTAPVPQVCRRRTPSRSGGRWPLAHPLFVALDLAGDPGRGREVLDGWEPEDGTARVW
jgi:hypothetical protein